MNIIDIAIILIILFGFSSGYQKGLFYEIISLFGFVIAIILAFTFKNKLSIILYENLPFINFDFLFKGASVFNILAYEIIAFLVILLLVLFLLSFVKIITRLFQSIVNYSKILAFPLKLTGGILGSVKALLTVFIILFILTFFNINYIKDSKIAEYVIHNTPVLSNTIKDSIDVTNEFYLLKESYSNDNMDMFNFKALNLFLDKKVVTIESVKVLRQKNKLNFNGIDDIIERYDKIEN